MNFSQIGQIAPASMGPPPFGDGNNAEPVRRTGEPHGLQWGHRLSAMETDGMDGGGVVQGNASMGPPPFGDGNHHWGRDNDYGSHASMGPPPFGDGNHMSSQRSSHLGMSLQWGHRLSAMETPANGPTAASAAARFNGATAFRRWKPHALFDRMIRA